MIGSMGKVAPLTGEVRCMLVAPLTGLDPALQGHVLHVVVGCTGSVSGLQLMKNPDVAVLPFPSAQTVICRSMDFALHQSPTLLTRVG